MTLSLSSTPFTHPHEGQSQRHDPDDPENSHDDLTAPKKRKRRPGRPLLSFAQLRARKAAREAVRQSKNKWKSPSQQTETSATSILETTQSKRRNGSSALEQLPVELLERIFLYALETNFCRASPFLASAVSSERNYRTLIRLAFFKDGDFPRVSGELRQQIRTARDAIADALKPADYRTMRLDEADRVNLQATILRCRWCTKQRLLAQLPTLMQMIVWKHWVGAGIVLVDPEQQTDLDYILQGRGEEYVKNFPRRDVFKGIGPDGIGYGALITSLDRVNIHSLNPELDIDVAHQVMNIRVIPDYLLRGRRKGDGDKSYFTDEDTDLLEIFRAVYGCDGNGHDVQFSRDALQSGIRTAISAWHEKALSSLLRLDEFMFRQRLENEPPPGLPNLRTGQFYAIPEEHFLRAIQLPMPDAMYCFLLLLRCNAESMPPDSSELTQWAMELSSYRRPAESNICDSDISLARRLGKWLLDFMIELPGYIEESRENPQEKAVFYEGCLNTDIRLGKRFLDEVCPHIRHDFESWEDESKQWVWLVSYDMCKQWFIDVQ